jgi:hypothetical protein
VQEVEVWPEGIIIEALATVAQRRDCGCECS